MMQADAIAPESTADRMTFGSRRFSYGWIEVAVLFCLSLVIQGITLGGITLFDERVLKALDISRSQLKLRDSIFLLASATCCFLLGHVVEAIGVRLTMIAGLAALSMAMLIYSTIPPLWLLYLVHVLLGFALSTAHVVMIMIVLTRWFPADDPRRGVALGISVAGASFGAVVMAQVVAGLLGHFVWTTVFLWLASLPLLLMLPTWLLIRTNKRSAALVAPGNTSSGAGFRAAIGAVFRSPQAALLLLGILPVFYVTACITVHIVLLLRGEGLSLPAAAVGVSIMFTFGLIGKIGSGFVLARVPLRVCWLTFLALIFAGSILLWAMPREGYAIAVALIGLGWGGCFPLAQLRIAAAFPGPNLARILGLFVLIESIGSALGAWLTAILYDASGGYNLPLAVNAGLIAIAWLISFASPTPKLQAAK
jgi:MFS family permease